MYIDGPTRNEVHFPNTASPLLPSSLATAALLTLRGLPAPRRRSAKGLTLALPRAATARVTDDQASLDALMLVSNVELDFGRQVATLEVWG